MAFSPAALKTDFGERENPLRLYSMATKTAISLKVKPDSDPLNGRSTQSACIAFVPRNPNDLVASIQNATAAKTAMPMRAPVM